MAAPHVAGVAALMKSVNPNLTPRDFDLLLAGAHPETNIRITDDLGATGKDSLFGNGLINAANAVRAAAAIAGGTVVSQPVIQVFPSHVDFGAVQTTAGVEVQNVGSGDLSVISVIRGKPWISVNPTAGGAGPYAVSVDRAGLADGVFTGSIEFTSNGGSAVVTVRMSVGSAIATGGDVGTVYVLVLDPESGETLDQAEATAPDYEFSFSNLLPGEYLLVAGTDLDDDLFITNVGEALGAFPTLSRPELLAVFQSRSDLIFNVGFEINLQIPSVSGAAGAGGVAKDLSWRRLAERQTR